jgi:hypothetical protein
MIGVERDVADGSTIDSLAMRDHATFVSARGEAIGVYTF